MIERTLTRAREGDEAAFRELTDPFRRELQVHCYRILGSLQDAEDVLQETFLAAWRGLDGYEGRASLRAWLYRIATNRCLNFLRDAGRRPQEATAGYGQTAFTPPEPTRVSEPIWLQPYPEVLLEGLPDAAPGPEARYEAKEAVALGFVAGLQHLAPRQRAVLVLRDVLGFHAAEVAAMLEVSEASVNSALQRARAAFDTRLPAGDREHAPLPDSPVEREVVGRFVEALAGGEIDEVVALLTDDAWLTMPPDPREFQGHDAIGRFFADLHEWRGDQRLRFVPIRANHQPALGYYIQDPRTPIAHCSGILVLRLEGDRIAALTRFGDTSIFPHFGLPRTLR